MSNNNYLHYAVGLAIGLAAGLLLAPDAKEVFIDNETKWCFYQEVQDMKDYEATQRPHSSFIVPKGSRYHVFAPCETFDWYEAAKRP